jgi:zinc/manganese transport system substrate-binding protein
MVPTAVAAASVLALSGCATATAGGSATDSGAEGAAVQVVASTSVYGSIAEAIGGDAVEVTSIVTSASQDPHSFEPSARDQLTVSDADLIIENGGGYDAFVDALIEASGSTAHVITAVEFSHEWPENAGHEEEGDDHAEGEEDHAEGEEDHAEGEDEHSEHAHVEGFNEHVWYDPHTMEYVAEAIAAELVELAPDDAATFEANLEAFVAGIAEIEASLDDIAAAHEGDDIFVTEPVPLHLTAAAGLVNVTPDAFTEAVEEGQDVAPATLLEAMDLLRSGSVRAVIVNAQTGGAETTAVIDEASAQDIPVVEFAETVPDGQTYLSWMTSNVEALADALA